MKQSRKAAVVSNAIRGDFGLFASRRSISKEKTGGGGGVE